jgi:hypothetical protein
MLEAGGWSLPSLLTHYGAQTAYRVTRDGGRVSLEGRRGPETCLLRSESTLATARQLLGYQPPVSIWHPSNRALLAQPDSVPRM